MMKAICMIIELQKDYQIKLYHCSKGRWMAVVTDACIT